MYIVLQKIELPNGSTEIKTIAVDSCTGGTLIKSRSDDVDARNGIVILDALARASKQLLKQTSIYTTKKQANLLKLDKLWDVVGASFGPTLHEYGTFFSSNRSTPARILVRHC